jgi:hypothetical protein
VQAVEEEVLMILLLEEREETVEVYCLRTHMNSSSITALAI